MALALVPPDVATVLDDLLTGVRDVLGPEFVGMYLSGSIATGSFDRASDVDVVIVTETEIADARVETLDAMHQRIAQREEWCATQLECTYISRAAVRRFDPDLAQHASLSRGVGERLAIVAYDEGWVVHCHVLATHGITLAGPPPATLIDEVTPAALRAAMLTIAASWPEELLANPDSLRSRNYQSYVVLSLCRMRYTLETGAVASKDRAAAWALHVLPARWHALIRQALIDRQLPPAEAQGDSIRATLEFLRDTQTAAITSSHLHPPPCPTPINNLPLSR